MEGTFELGPQVWHGSQISEELFVFLLRHAQGRQQYDDLKPEGVLPTCEIRFTITGQKFLPVQNRT